MINGAHVILYSKDVEADRAFLRDILGLPHVDVGHGWLIFGLPPAEVAVHPIDDTGAHAFGAGSHELYLMCDDIERFRAELAGHGVATGPLQRAGWGVITDFALPGGGKVRVYQPRHARAPAMPGPGAGSSPAAGSKPAASSRSAASKSARSKPAASTKKSGAPTSRKPAKPTKPARRR